MGESNEPVIINMNLHVDYYRKHLQRVAVPADREPMERYMRNQFDFIGVKSVARREVMRVGVRDLGIPEQGEWPKWIAEMWGAERELQYIAMDLLKRRKRHLTEANLPLLEWMITNKSWWDTVDIIAPHLVGAVFRNTTLRDQWCEKWMNDGNLWLLRSTIIFQLGYKDQTDRDFLMAVIEASMHHSDFFIRKAIGWALRQYARVDADWVKRTVDLLPLAPLSRREALKHL